LILSLFLALLSFSFSATAQSRRKQPTTEIAPTPLLTRTTTRTETRRLSYGGTLTLTGAPTGSITIEAWPQNEIEITADIELRAPREEDLARLAAVNNFVVDKDANHINITTTGTHDRRFMRRTDKNFPKELLGLPWKIDYRIRVPAFTDMEIYGGRGAINITNVEGAIRLNAGESQTTLTLTGGGLLATVERGSVLLRVPVRSWRGRGVEVRLAQGDMDVELAPNFNADITASILRTGRIENSYPSLLPRESDQHSAPPTERNLQARAGAGGAPFSFTVGDGTLRIKQFENK
ncbi:MAG: hypothetical protein H0V88_07940, partial [Pyrinomonadaceae bacterium]|nr:hypothetical protein [Pyrinomonadaceae bacterium]